jgi:hypothetical protein
MFRATTGRVDSINLSRIRSYILNTYEDEINKRSSHHEYIKNSTPEIIEEVDKIRMSPEITSLICKQFEKCEITPLTHIDEIYISHYNIDNGGDQGLYEKHYDGPLQFLKGATIVRCLLYVNSDDDYVVHFVDSGISKNFKTGEFALFDFNKELHWVDGKYDENNPPSNTRLVLKLNYIVCPECTNIYEKMIIFVNKLIYYVVKASMEYSKSPRNIFQRIVGIMCNLFRSINNIHPALNIVAILSILYLVILLIRYTLI